MNSTKNPEFSEDFVLRKHADYSDDITIKKGGLTVETNGAFLSKVTMIESEKPVILEDRAFIYELHMMNGGEIFFKGKNIWIVNLVTEDKLTLHIPKSVTDWRIYVETANDCLIKVIQDQDG